MIEEKIFPGYVLVEMTVTDDSWYMVRNTPNVTGFIGSGTTPTPISDEEVKSLQKEWALKSLNTKLTLKSTRRSESQTDRSKNLKARFRKWMKRAGKIKVLVSMFGRETPVELDFYKLKNIIYGQKN